MEKLPELFTTESFVRFIEPANYKREESLSGRVKWRIRTTDDLVRSTTCILFGKKKDIVVGIIE